MEGFISLFQQAIVFGTIIMFGAVGEIITEKSGNLNLGVPGIMYLGGISSLVGVFFYENSTDHPSKFLCAVIALLCAFFASALGGLIFSFLTITLRANQNVTGLTLTIFGSGVANFFGGSLNQLSGGVGQLRVPVTSDAFRATLPGVSNIGGVIGRLLFQYGWLAYVAIVIAILAQWYLNRTRTGLNLRAVGENPATADAAGLNVTLYKYLATCIGAGISGLGGLYYVMDFTQGKWANDGTIFFQGTSTAQHGTFWEMPNITPLTSIEGGKSGQYLFTCTPLGTNAGVRTLCWVGTIGADGKFTPTGDMQYLEMGGISRDGYGLLSPTIYQKDGKTLLLGIVPDKLATEENYKMGWAHNFSLPREISIADDGSLVQRPYSGLAAMRKEEGFSGRQLELQGEFMVGSGACGFYFLKSGERQASLSYDSMTGILTLDYTTIDRISTDGGKWSAALPKKVSAGEKLKLHVFLDGSIADIFVNDTWAFSVRFFPTDANAVEAEAFGTADVKGWVLDAKQSVDTRIGQIVSTKSPNNKYYSLQGRRLAAAPQKGLYIMNGKKYVSR